jgi:hypothetical protein
MDCMHSPKNGCRTSSAICDSGSRTNNVRAFEGCGIRQTRLVDDLIAVEQNIQIEQPRSPAIFGVAISAVIALDRQQQFEQFARRKSRAQLRRRIQVSTLLAGADRFGLDEFADSDDIDTL